VEREAWLAVGGDLFESVAEQELALERRRLAFLQGADRVAVLHTALHDPTKRRTALNLIPYLSPEEQEQLFDDLLELASVGHSDIAAARAAIMQLPREWVVSIIETRAERLLSGPEPWEEYRRLLELYTDLDPELTRRLASRAKQHDDPDVKETGADFLERTAPG
jgi:hypothetical protein